MPKFAGRETAGATMLSSLNALFGLPVVFSFFIFLFYCCPGNFMRNFFPGIVFLSVFGVLILLPGIIECRQVDFSSMFGQYLSNRFRQIFQILIRHIAAPQWFVAFRLCRLCIL